MLERSGSTATTISYQCNKCHYVVQVPISKQNSIRVQQQYENVLVGVCPRCKDEGTP